MTVTKPGIHFTDGESQGKVLGTSQTPSQVLLGALVPLPPGDISGLSVLTLVPSGQYGSCWPLGMVTGVQPLLAPASPELRLGQCTEPESSPERPFPSHSRSEPS